MPNPQLVLGQSVEISVAALDGANNLIEVFNSTTRPGTVTWSGGSPYVQLIPSPDGNVCKVVGAQTHTGNVITATAVLPAGTLTATFTIDVVTNVPVSLVITEAPQTPGDQDVRQLAAGGRYLGLGFSSPPNA